MLPICPPPVAASKDTHWGIYRRVRYAGRTHAEEWANRCFGGCKKHALRLLLHHYLDGVQLVPLVQLGDTRQCFRG